MPSDLKGKDDNTPELGSKYTAWSSVSTLIQKELVVKTHNPARYALSEEGSSLAERLALGEQGSSGGQGGEDGREEEEEEEEAAAAAGVAPGMVDLTVSDEEQGQEEGGGIALAGPSGAGKAQASGPSGAGKAQASGSSGGGLSGLRLLPGDYDIILCVDFIETTGGSNHRKQDLVKELQRNGVTFDVRKLNVGDFLWVARQRVAPVPGQLRAPVAMELVLDYIIERKRMDDLVQDVRESAAYLTVMTRYLTKLYQNCPLVCRSRELEGDGGTEPSPLSSSGPAPGPSLSLLSFAEFNYGAIKNKCQTVREVFARHLLRAYESCPSEVHREKLLSNIRYGKLNRNIGPALSRTVYQLYCTQGPLS
ncbi:hypothetical protein CRUP_034793 [Coryphaenoides rupestris]|nr:hypothetical protein CRUP_034793 [Coryphaenoides rupestris]